LMSGFTDNYLKVELPYQVELINTLQPVRLEKINSNGCFNGRLQKFSKLL